MHIVSCAWLSVDLAIQLTVAASKHCSRGESTGGQQIKEPAVSFDSGTSSAMNDNAIGCHVQVQLEFFVQSLAV